VPRAVTFQTLETGGSVFPRFGKNRTFLFQGLEIPALPFSKAWKNQPEIFQGLEESAQETVFPCPPTSSC
jgi:hypothetical protein